MIELGDIENLPHAHGREFSLGQNAVLVVNWHGEFYAYLNRCPHAGWPLNLQPDQFFNVDKSLLQCSNHMAMFSPETGLCVAGPCAGGHLTPVDIGVMGTKAYIKNSPETDTPHRTV